jgi:predicted DNA-binding transcriptional regulator AlpA
MQPTSETIANIRKPLRRAELAELLGVTTKTIDNRRKTGELPPSFMCGAERLWRPQDVEAWMERRVQLELQRQSLAENAAKDTRPRALAAASEGPAARRTTKRVQSKESALLRRLNAEPPSLELAK